MKKDKPTCWIITEGIAGTENQCIGVAGALGLTPDIKRIILRRPWKALSPYLGFECARTFTEPLVPPWPDLLLSAGRKSIAAARYIKNRSGAGTFTVHIQDPRINPKHFDLVAVPAHDRLAKNAHRYNNVMVTKAAPNRITPELLAQAKEDFPQFESVKKPRVAVLIGGSSKAYTLSSEVIGTLARQLRALDAGLMITTSRRTGAENKDILKQALEGTQAYLYEGQGPNPYMALLAWADFILVTGDSASMLSEAGTTGKPVYMVRLPGGTKRIHRMHDTLRSNGVMRDFDGALARWTYDPLDDSAAVAQAIKARFKMHP